MSAMARNSRRRAKPPARAYTARAPYSAPTLAAPSLNRSPVPPWAAFTPRRSRTPVLAPSVIALRTVRPYLMRTVRTDTTKSPWVSPSRRLSPDIPNRALARSNPWNTYLDRAWPVLSDQIPLQRATTCARRSIRREVLLALGRGNGAGSRGVPKSLIRCSR